jgi:hypothetical protein
LGGFEVVWHFLLARMQHHFFTMKTFIFALLFAFSGNTLIGQPFSLVPYRDKDSWGYAEVKGTVKIKPQFNEAHFFNEDGLARVKVKGLYGYINTEGLIVIPPQFTKASDFLMGIATVEKNKQRFCINTEGLPEACDEEQAMLPEEAEQEEVHSPFVIIPYNNRYALTVINRNDTLVTDADQIEIAAVHGFTPSLWFAVVTRKGLKGAYNSSGHCIAPVQYQDLEIFSSDAFKAFDGRYWGVVSYDQQIVLPFEYDDIRYVQEFTDSSIGGERDQRFIVRYHGTTGVVNNHNQFVLAPEYDAIVFPKQCSCQPEFVITKNGLSGVADYHGKIIAEPRYRSIEPFRSSAITRVITASNREGYVHRSGLEYFRD